MKKFATLTIGQAPRPDLAPEERSENGRKQSVGFDEAHFLCSQPLKFARAEQHDRAAARFFELMDLFLQSLADSRLS